MAVHLLVEIPWAPRVWALPFLRVLAPYERYAARRGKRHKKITEWAWQMLLVLRCHYPEREIVAVADGAYASLKLLDRCRKLSDPITFVTRLRLDAALYEPAPPRRPGQIGKPRLKGERLPNLSVMAEDPNTAWEPTKIYLLLEGTGSVTIEGETRPVGAGTSVFIPGNALHSLENTGRRIYGSLTSLPQTRLRRSSTSSRNNSDPHTWTLCTQVRGRVFLRSTQGLGLEVRSSH